MKKYFIVFLSAIILFGCAYKRLAKEAFKFEQAGMYASAIDKYMAALQKKQTYQDARIGLMRNATVYKDQLRDKIEENYATLNDNALVDNYLLLKKLKEKVEPYQIYIDIDARIEGQYDEVQARYLNDHYEKARQLVDSDNFSQALNELNKVNKVNPSYQQTRELTVYCKCEPLYRDGKQCMEQKRYKAAYSSFGKVLVIDKTFKDTYDLQQEALNKGMLTVAFLPISISYPNYVAIADRVVAQTKEAVQKKNDPFLRMVDYYQTEEQIKEQKMAMAYNLDLTTGKIIPVRMHLSCHLTNVSHTPSKLTKTKKKGFLREEKADKTIIYKKIYYYEYEQTLYSNAVFSYDMKSTESGLIVFSGSATPSYTDKIKYITYTKGNANTSLCSGYWENQNAPFNPDKDYVYDNFLSRAAVLSLVNARRTFKPFSEIDSYLADKIAQTISAKLISYCFAN